MPRPRNHHYHHHQHFLLPSNLPLRPHHHLPSILFPASNLIFLPPHLHQTLSHHPHYNPPHQHLPPPPAQQRWNLPKRTTHPGNASSSSKTLPRTIITTLNPSASQIRRSSRGCRRSLRCLLRVYQVRSLTLWLPPRHHHRAARLTLHVSGVSYSCIADTILVRTYEDRMDLLRCVILGPAGTPYIDAPYAISFCLLRSTLHAILTLL